MGVSWTFPFCEFQLQLVPLIPYSAIAKTILVRSRIFHIFTRAENQPIKQRLQLKRRIILKNLQNIFSFAKLKEKFLFFINISWNYSLKKRSDRYK